MGYVMSLLVPAQYNTAKNKTTDFSKLDLNYENAGFFGALHQFHRMLGDKFDAAGKGSAARWQRLGQDYVPGNPGAALRATLVQEEANELIEALSIKPAHEVLKEVCDLVYVATAIPVLYGWQFERAFEITHNNNLGKLEHGTIREDGKLVKPANWVNANVKDCV